MKRCLTASVMAVMVCLATSSLSAQLVMTHTDVVGPAGAELTGQVLMDVSDVPSVAGWSIACCYDDENVTIMALEMGDAIVGFDGGSGPDFYGPNLSASVAGWTVGVVLDFFGEENLPPGLGYELHRPIYVLGDDARGGDFCFCNAPLCVETVVVDTLGMSHVPEMVCGSYLVTGPWFRRGDANVDGVFGLADCIQMLNFLFSPGVVAPCELALDANDDESVGLADPIYGLNALFSNGPEIPEPLEACAVDPTPGALTCDSLIACP